MPDKTTVPDKKPKPLFVEFHVLRSYPPSNLNRDDLGSPKSIVFGAERRVRVSSQCLKRTWRMSPFFRDEFNPVDLGTRTKRLAELVEKDLPKDFSSDAREGLTQVFAVLGKKDDAEAKGDSGSGEENQAPAEPSPEDGDVEKTAHLLFLSQGEVDAVVKFASKEKEVLETLGQQVKAESDEKTKATAAKKAATLAAKKGRLDVPKEPKTTGKKPASAATATLKELRAKLKRFLEETAPRSAVDVALFGRFLTSDEFGECNAALQVAHALGTQKLDLAYDYFTAVDDRQPSGETGAGHLGETELCASVLYEYAVCAVDELVKNLAGDVPLSAHAMKAIALAMCRSIFEKAKKNGTAPHTPADFLEVVIRKDAPMSLANAFLKPVRPGGDMDVMDVSIKRLQEQETKYDEAYGEEHVVKRFVLDLRAKDDNSGLDNEAASDQKRVRYRSLASLADAVKTAIEKAINAPEAKE